jgi:hypothetical protein
MEVAKALKIIISVRVLVIIIARLQASVKVSTVWAFFRVSIF